MSRFPNSEATRSRCLTLLSDEEQKLRLKKLRDAMARNCISYGLISGNTSKYYLTGRVFLGYILVTLDSMTCYVRRPVELEGPDVVYIRKPEEIKAPAGKMALELDELSYSGALRLSAVFGEEYPLNLSPALMEARSVKTDFEIEMLRYSGRRQAEVYNRIPSLYKPGMSDIDLQIEIERESRREGCLGQFRISGDSMELFMGNVLAGDNADSPSPFDFAMGGAGLDPSVPVGADNTKIEPGMAVMVDVNGNYNGYMTDMTRIYSAGPLDEKALEAHRCSIAIHRRLQAMGKPGVKASEMYEAAAEEASKAGLADYFMGHRQKAGFVGHGVGIEINERPVLAPRSRDILQLRNVIAIEPKFVIPGVGAVGNEDTYVVREDGLERITLCDEAITDLYAVHPHYI